MQHQLLNLTSNYFSKLNIQSMVINLDDPLPNNADLGLRNNILSGKDINGRHFPKLPFTKDEKHLIHFTTDMYNCNYCLIPIPDQELPLALLLGPYLTEPTHIKMVNELRKLLGIPESLGDYLIQYYSSVPYVDSASSIDLFIDSLGMTLFGEGKYEITYKRQHPDSASEYVASPDVANNTDIISIIEKRYDYEEKIMAAISQGDYKKALHYSQDNTFTSLDDRASSSLRSRKNYMIILNTLCRKAAQRSSVHPVYLDEISRKVAHKIEAMSSQTQTGEITKEIIRRYCLLVQQTSTEGYSPLIQRAVNHISSHLFESSLTLQSTAAALSINKSYLVTLFKKETEETFTSYVNKRRIDHAIFLLNTTLSTVVEIAESCGIPDVTYFIRLFKKEKGMTPSQYRKMIRNTD